MHHGFYFWQTKRCQQTHVPSLDTYITSHIQASRHLELNFPPRYIPPWHSVLTIHRRIDRQTRRSRKERKKERKKYPPPPPPSRLPLTTVYELTKVYMIESPALPRYDVLCAKSLTSTNDDHDHDHDHDTTTTTIHDSHCSNTQTPPTHGETTRYALCAGLDLQCRC